MIIAKPTYRIDGLFIKHKLQHLEAREIKSYIPSKIDRIYINMREYVRLVDKVTELKKLLEEQEKKEEENATKDEV